MDGSSSHWKLPIQSDKLHNRGIHLVFNVDLLDINNGRLRKHVQIFFYKSEEQLMKLFQMAGKDTARIKSIVKDVVETCNICRRYKKTPPRPKVAMPKANTVKEVVSLYLKERRDLKKQILYIKAIKAFDKWWVREPCNT